MERGYGNRYGKGRAMKGKWMLLLMAACVSIVPCGCGGSGDDESAQAQQEGGAGEGDTASSETAVADYDPLDYVDMGEYSGLEITLDNYEVTEDDVRESIESAILSHPVYEDTDKEVVEDGDFVNIDYEGVKDGVAFDGGTASGYVLEIGSDSFIDGFEDGLVGAKVGEKRDLNLTFPEDYGSEDLAGQAVVFHVTVNKIVKQADISYDTLTDQYVSDNFSSEGYKTVDELKEGTKKQLESSNESKRQSDLQEAVFAKLQENCKVEKLPDGILEENTENYLKQFEEGLTGSYGMTLEQYLAGSNMTEEQFRSQAEETMRDSLTSQIILEAIAKTEGIEADEAGFEEYVQGVVSDYGYESKEALFEQTGEDYVKRAYVTDKALGIVMDSAKITYSDQPQEGEG